MALCAAMAGGPALALMHASAPPSASPPHVLAGEIAVSTQDAQPPPEATGGVATTVTSEPPTTVAPVTSSTSSTTVARVRTIAARTATSTTVPRRTATTVKTAPKPAPAPAKSSPKPSTGSSGSGSGSATAPSGRSQSGGATWYDAAPPGTCAHKTLPMGAVVNIRSSSGATAQCTVRDRGPYADGMIIDLAKDVFQRLAPLSQGVVQVTISW